MLRAALHFELGEKSGIAIGRGEPLLFIAGPCVIEGTEQTLGVARELAAIAQKASVNLVFKASFDKANRSSIKSFRGPGIEAGLEILRMVKEETGLLILTDVHEPWQAEEAAEVADILQVPAFLSRQTDLLLACGRTGKPVNIKKGQFMSPSEIALAVEKVLSTGNNRVMVTERGTFFGYHNLVVDMRSLPQMAEFAPVVFDATHSLQRPAAAGSASGGDKKYYLPMVRAAVACGVDAVFAEVHQDPPRALSDPATQLSPEEFTTLVRHAQEMDKARRRLQK